MYSIGDDFNTPAMYRDLASGPMGMNMMPMGMYGPMCGGMYGGMYGGGIASQYPRAGGILMRPQPADDIYVSNEVREKKDMSFAKKAGLVLGGLIAVGFIPPLRKHIKAAGGLTKCAKSTWKDITKSVKNFFK